MRFIKYKKKWIINFYKLIDHYYSTQGLYKLLDVFVVEVSNVAPRDRCFLIRCVSSSAMRKSNVR